MAMLYLAAIFCMSFVVGSIRYALVSSYQRMSAPRKKYVRRKVPADKAATFFLAACSIQFEVLLDHAS